CFRHYFMKQLKPFWFERNAQAAYTGDIAARPVHPGGEALLHRITGSLKDDRYHGGSRFCRETRSRSADSGNDGNLATDKISRHLRQSVVLTRRRAILDRNVLALNIAGREVCGLGRLGRTEGRPR